MALIKCPSCSASISDRAAACPQCGRAFSRKAPPKSNPVRWAVAAAVAFGVISVIGMSMSLALRKPKPVAPAPVAQQELPPPAAVAPVPTPPPEGCTRPPFELFPPGTAFSAANFERDLRRFCPGASSDRTGAVLSHDGRRYRLITTSLVEPNGLRAVRIETIRAE